MAYGYSGVYRPHRFGACNAGLKPALEVNARSMGWLMVDVVYMVGPRSAEKIILSGNMVKDPRNTFKRPEKLVKGCES
jgi:hypothetical protein